MSVNSSINDQARKHLVRFLKKVIDGSYTQNELEDFSMASYSNQGFERVRAVVVKTITEVSSETSIRTPLSDDDKRSIEEVVCELEQQGI